MEKVKLEDTGSSLIAWEQVKIFGNEIQIKNYLTYNEKEDCATEYASMVCVIDEDKQIAYIGYQERFALAYCYAKYYTNIDMDDFLERYGDSIFIDQLIANVEFFAVDRESTKEMMLTYANKVVEIYEKYHSPAARFMTAFGGIFDGTNIVETIAEDRELNDTIIGVLNAKQQKETERNKIAQFAQFAKKH